MTPMNDATLTVHFVEKPLHDVLNGSPYSQLHADDALSGV